MPDDSQPILNPVLSLRREARPEAITGGGKSAKHIRADRLPGQQAKLVTESRSILTASGGIPSFAGTMRLVARMFPESLAASFTPDNLLSQLTACRLLVPVADGYVFEATVDALHKLIKVIQNPVGIATRVDISRVATIEPFDVTDVTRGRELQTLWDAASECDDGRLFIVWLAPFRSPTARNAVMTALADLSDAHMLTSTRPSVRLLPGTDPDGQRLVIQQDAEQGSVPAVLRRYRNTGHGTASVIISSKDRLAQVIASGTVHRIEPVRRLTVTAAGEGREPHGLPADLSREPIVGVIDGGLTATSYLPAEAWRAPPFVPNGKADHPHGNRVASLVVQGHAWNGNLPLPKLHCRVGIAQAVPKSDVPYPLNHEQLVNYVHSVVIAHPETKVWNLSFNELEPVDVNAVSYLGHSFARIARTNDVLFVISGGNPNGSHSRIAPPADCEAGIVVGGRRFDENGNPSEFCPSCAGGLGPEGMLKPDLSWYSPLRALGGLEVFGSSYPTALMSSLAAHTFENLKAPSPDMVRALLLNSAEQEGHDRRLGWGTPYQGHEPWRCQPGSVTMLWTSKLRAKTAYYWEGIPVPDELTKDGKLFGKASLTAIIQPLTRDEGDANYFITRIQVSLQYQNSGKWQSLLGSMKEDTEAEEAARSEFAKWYPVRGHRRDFSRRDGLSFTHGSTMRLFARVFARDLYQLDLPPGAELGEHNVAFALSFSNSVADSGLYNAMKAGLGTFVESAVVETEVELRAAT